VRRFDVSCSICSSQISCACTVVLLQITRPPNIGIHERVGVAWADPLVQVGLGLPSFWPKYFVVLASGSSSYTVADGSTLTAASSRHSAPCPGPQRMVPCDPTSLASVKDSRQQWPTSWRPQTSRPRRRQVRDGLSKPRGVQHSQWPHTSPLVVPLLQQPKPAVCSSIEACLPPN
jgi:hypothetical protein